MDLIALALKDVEARFVLVTVAVIGPAGLELDEVHLQGLGQERVVPGPEHPRRV